MTSAGNGGLTRFFRSKDACFALFQFKLLGELYVAMFDNGVFGFLPICVSKGEIFVTPCGVFLSVFIISATSEANLYGVFDRKKLYKNYSYYDTSVPYGQIMILRRFF